MSNEGKKLQDVYDAGSAKLADLEQAQKAELKAKSDEYLSADKEQQKSAIDRTRKKSKELETDIQSSLNRSLERIERIIELEKQETESHVNEISSKLSVLAKKLNTSIEQIRRSKDSSFVAASNDSCDLFVREIEHAKADLQKQHHHSMQSVKAQSTFVLNTFQQKLDYALIEIRGEERQFNSTLFKAVLQNTNAVDTNVSGSLQTLSAEYQTHNESLTSRFQESELKLQSHAEAVLEESDKLALETEQKLREFFERISADCAASLESHISNSSRELTCVHESASHEVSELTEKLGKDLASTAEVLEQKINEAAGVSKTTMSKSIDTYIEDSQKRLETSLQLQEAVSQKKNEALSKIKQDLSDLQSAFEQRIEATATGAMQDLSSLCGQAEQTIRLTQQSCESTLQSIAGSSRVQVQAAVTDFLKRLKERREAALEEIFKAASGKSGSLRQPNEENSSGKRSKRTRKNTAETPIKTDKGGGQ